MEVIKLDLIPSGKMPSLHASQYDDGREHGIDLFENGVVYKLDGTETLTINERKGDDCICSLDIENTFSDSNHIVFASTEQMCAVWGNNICELVIAKGEKTIGTLNFILEIEQSPTEGGIESESEIKNLERQIEDITEEVIGDDYYTAEQTDNAIATATEGKADTTYVNTELAKKADKTYVDSIIDETAEELQKKADKSNTYTKTEVDEKIGALPEPMIFKGTLGVGGTITELPDASASNEGYTYKVITDGTYAGQTAKVGDVFTSNGSAWVYIPSGDEDNDTWRAIKVEGVEVLGNGISSGAVDFVGSENIEVEFDANGNKVGIKTKNIYTKNEVDDIVYGILPDDTASGSVANFATSLELPIKSLEVDVNAVQESGTPTPATPLPISGWSEISLVNCGANLCNQADIVGAYPTKYTVDTDGSIKTVGNLGLADVLWTNKSKVSGVLNVVFVSKYQNTGSVGIRPKVIYTDGTASIIYTTNTQDYSVKTLLTTSSKTVEKIVVDYGTNNPTNFSLEVTLDTSASTYEPYNGTTEVIQLGGTYYGGHFTQDKDGHRQFVVTHGYGQITSATNKSGTWDTSTGNGAFWYNTYAGGITWLRLWDNSATNNGIVCDTLRLDSNVTAYDTDSGISIYSNEIIRWIDVEKMALSLADYNTYLAEHPINVCYPLKTPIIIDLPDREPINTINGTNNIYADTGDSTVVFKCSVNDYINAHQGGGAKSLGGVFLGSSNSGSEEEPTEESEDAENTEKVKEHDEPKEEIKTIGDIKKLGGE